MRRPQHATSSCQACEGAGRGLSEEWEGDGMRVVSVRCEGCDGAGLTTSCDACDEVLSLPEAEQNGYVCGPCAADHERGDARAEIARIGRAG